MDRQYFSPEPKQDKTMTTEQFNQIVDAILSGKYSWACVLILRFAGYNPLHYIPYRTYNRLIKDNRQASEQPSTTMKKTRQKPTFKTKKIERQAAKQYISQIADLSYLDVVEEQSQCVQGGYNPLWWDVSEFNA